MAVPSLPADLMSADLSAAEAATTAGVKVATIYKWVQRGHLEPCRRDSRGRPRFRFLDLARAEYATRERARRVWPAVS